jgi:hypothetical protein
MHKEKKLKKFFPFQLYECAAVEEFLKEMSLKGWMLEKIKGSFFTFTKIEPKEINFAVDIFDKASVFDTKLSNNTIEYIEYCKMAGWEYICSYAKIQVFYSENKNQIPIHTESRLKLKTINKAMFPNVFSFFVFIFTSIIFFSIQASMNYYESLSDYTKLIMYFSYVLISFFYLIYLADYSIWLIKSINNLKKGQEIEYNSMLNKCFKNRIFITIIIINIILLTGLLIYSIVQDFNYSKLGFALVIVVILLIFSIIYFVFFKNKNHSRTNNILFTIIIIIISFYLFNGLILSYFIFNISNNHNTETVSNGISTFTLTHDQVPLTLEDLGVSIQGYHESTADINKTLIAQSYNYSDYYFINNIDSIDKKINYSIFTTPYKWILNGYLEKKLNNSFDIIYTETDSSIWGANCAYISTTNNSYIIVYNAKIVEIKSNIELNNKLIDIIKEKLDLSN